MSLCTSDCKAERDVKEINQPVNNHEWYIIKKTFLDYLNTTKIILNFDFLLLVQEYPTAGRMPPQNSFMILHPQPTGFSSYPNQDLIK